MNAKKTQAYACALCGGLHATKKEADECCHCAYEGCNNVLNTMAGTGPHAQCDMHTARWLLNDKEKRVAWAKKHLEEATEELDTLRQRLKERGVQW
jgi:hypothetical protein